MLGHVGGVSNWSVFGMIRDREIINLGLFPFELGNRSRIYGRKIFSKHIYYLVILLGLRIDSDVRYSASSFQPRSEAVGSIMTTR